MDSIAIGWDVGGWHCDRNAASRDALVLLDAERAILGRPWRGNLRVTIESASTTDALLHELFRLCATDFPEAARCTLAIDTPLGFPAAFTRLVTGGGALERIGDHSGRNPYLFRATETFLLDHGITPLSAVKDMIGSQATKGMHVLAKFAPGVLSCGVWSDGGRLTVIEAYPSPCRRSSRMKALLAAASSAAPAKRDDRQDAHLCALVAHLFATERESLAAPGPEVPPGEGWIWVPQDVLGR